ncbi:hypothetical protein CDAR_617011 [Caerostris darwini]|uniref:Uncharacterized protein n=1 Tax=Caerostris darwini TaxID=1538125 RepID=A0AAV4NSN0_9ARAC|nr:hypothetical protein CDAR_617011 [Caerostris darwini]
MSCVSTNDELINVEVGLDEPCEDIPQTNNELTDLALSHYLSLVNLTDRKELKRKDKKAFRKQAMASLTIITTQSNNIAQLEGRISELEKNVAIQEMEKTLATKAGTHQTLISEAVAREAEKILPAMASAQAQTPTYAEMATLRAKEPGSKVPDTRERSKSRQKPAMKTDKKFLTAIKSMDTTASSNSTKAAVQSKINIKRAKIGIKNVKFIKNGGLLVETESEEDLDKLIEEFKQIVELNNKYTINKPIARKPQIIYFDVSKNLEEK